LVTLLFQSAQANLKLGLGGGLGGGAGCHLVIGVDGLVVLLLLLECPADAVMGFVYPRAVAESSRQALVGLPAGIPLLELGVSLAQAEQGAVAHARDILKLRLIAEDDEALDGLGPFLVVHETFAGPVMALAGQRALRIQSDRIELGKCRLAIAL